MESRRVQGHLDNDCVLECRLNQGGIAKGAPFVLGRRGLFYSYEEQYVYDGREALENL